MKRTALAVAGVLPFLVPAPAFAGGGCYQNGPSAQVATNTVTIDHACFGPAAAVVATGSTVTWKNTSGLAHNISGPGIEGADLPDGGTFTWSFAQAGLYPYACTIHPGMSGVVVVGAVPSVAPAVAPVAQSVPLPPSSPDSGPPRALWALAGAGVVALAWGTRRLAAPKPA